MRVWAFATGLILGTVAAALSCGIDDSGTDLNVGGFGAGPTTTTSSSSAGGIGGVGGVGGVGGTGGIVLVGGFGSCGDDCSACGAGDSCRSGHPLFSSPRHAGTDVIYATE